MRERYVSSRRFLMMSEDFQDPNNYDVNGFAQNKLLFFLVIWHYQLQTPSAKCAFFSCLSLSLVYVSALQLSIISFNYGVIQVSGDIFIINSYYEYNHSECILFGKNTDAKKG